MYHIVLREKCQENDREMKEDVRLTRDMKEVLLEGEADRLA